VPRYSTSVRRQVCRRLRAGDLVSDPAVETGISQATFFRWKAQILIDGGVRDGVPSIEADELAAAKRRITQVETELALTRDACALFDEQVVVTQKENRDAVG
jgi:hypothetical protein